MKKVRPSEGARCLYQMITAVFYLNEKALTVTQTAILRELAKAGHLNQRQITKASFIDRSTMADTLRRLGEFGLIQQARSVIDKRNAVVTITIEGRAALKRAEASLVMAESHMIRQVRRMDRPAFLRALQSIAEASR